MAIEKFISLMQTSSLYLPRADTLMTYDAKEGSLSKNMTSFIDSMITTQRIGELKRQNVTDFCGIRFAGQGRMQLRDLIRQKVRLHYKFMIERHYVNCWHINDHENDLMWRRFIPGSNGVAIQTSLSDLESSFIDIEAEVFGVPIQYVDLDTVVPDWRFIPGGMSQIAFDMLQKKRQPFKAESEFRLIADVMSPEEKWKEGLMLAPVRQKIYEKNPLQNLMLRVDLSRLIKKIVLQPNHVDEQKFRYEIISAINDHRIGDERADLVNKVQRSVI